MVLIHGPLLNSNFNSFLAVTFPFILVHNLLNMPAGVVPVTHVHQDDIEALRDLDDNDLGVKEIKQVWFLLKMTKSKLTV